jgi:NAD(P)-dependent dehydrogenase (short-subunit alcohol dehydrogenase family)
MSKTKKENIFSVKDKIVIVTGSSQGNGFAIASGFIENGSHVCGIDIKKPKDSSLTKSNKFNFFECDLSDDISILDVVKKIKKKYKKIDVLVNNAGISLPLRTGLKHFDDWDITHRVNLRAPFFLSSNLISVIKKGGSIINITSLGSLLGFPDNPSYISSKGGLKMLTKSLAVDYGKRGVRVNNILPGYMKTSMTKDSYSNKALKQERDNRMIMNRWGNSSDLVGPCIFLASSSSSYITGSDIIVDGGWTAKGL